MATAAPMREVDIPPYIAGMTKLDTYSEISEVLRSKSFRQGSHQESKPFFDRSLLMLDGPEHFQRRRLESVLFSKEALLYYEKTVLQPAIDRAMAEVSQQRDADGMAIGDLVPLTRRMLLEMTAAITGMDGVDNPEATELFGQYLASLGEGVTVEWSMEDHDAVIARVLAVRDEFVRDFYAPSVSRRRDLVERHRAGDLPASELPRDLATLMLLEHDPGWDPELPLRETTLYLVAGFQTTTHAVPHVVNHLTAWFEEHPEDRGRATDWEFLQRAAAESLRLHLPAPSLLRIATEDVTLSSGRRITEGERVALLFTPANRDPAVFGADADRFDPYREAPAPIKPWALAFGGGIHTCVGRQLVTGLSRTLDEVGAQEQTTAGISTQILAELYRAGVEMDPNRPWAFRAVSHHDAFDAFPVRFTAL
jgi:cytochrome P450